MGPIAGHGWILATKSHFRGRRSARIERGTEKHPVAAICTAHHGCPGAVLSSFVACAPALLRCPCQLRGNESNDETGCLGLPAEPTGMGRTEMEQKGPHARAAFPNPSIHVTHCRPPSPQSRQSVPWFRLPADPVTTAHAHSAMSTRSRSVLLLDRPDPSVNTVITHADIYGSQSGRCFPQHIPSCTSLKTALVLLSIHPVHSPINDPVLRFSPPES